MVKIISLMIILSIFIPMATAFGATAPYWSDRPLIMSSGELKTIQIILQNMVGNQDLKLKAEITSGNDIASFTNNDVFLVPFGKEDIKANLNIKIPKNPGKSKYQITISFNQITENNEETLQISKAVTISFPITIENLPIKKEDKVAESPSQESKKNLEQEQISPNSKKTEMVFYSIIIIFIIAISITIAVIVILIKKSNKESFLNSNDFYQT